MKRLSFVLTLVLCFGFVTVCLAMEKLETQNTETAQEVVREAEETVVAETYSAPEEAEEVKESMEANVESVQEVAAEPMVVEDTGALSDLGVLDEFKSLATTSEKVNLLLDKANEFYNSEQFQKAVDAAQYILQYLDADSQSAKDLLAEAKDALVASASEKIDDVTTGIGETLGDLGK